MPIPPGVLPPELATDIDVVTRKAGLTPWHARALRALEAIADYYENLPPSRASKAGGKDA